VTPVLWVEFNGIDADGTLSLNATGVLDQLAKLPVPLVEGQTVTLATDELEPGVADLWLRATVHPVAGAEYWEARSD
jgi:hypothetical protein